MQQSYLKFKDVLNNKSNWYKVGGVIASLGAALTIRKVLDVVWRKWNNYPPGPVGLPLFGSVRDIHKYAKILSLTNSYGSVIMIYFGIRKVVFINDIKIAKQFFNKPEGAKRSDYKLVTNRRSLGESYGKEFRFRRQLLHKSFVTVLDSNYLNKIGIKILSGNLFKKLDKAANDNTAVYLRNEIKYAVFGLIWVTIFGDYIIIPNQDDNEYITFSKYLDNSVADFAGFFNDKEMFQGVPGWDKYVRLFRRKSNFIAFDILQSLVDKWVNKATKSKNNNTHSVVCAIDSMLSALKDGSYKNENDLKRDVLTMFLAGIHTTSLFLSQAAIYCAKDQNMQQLIFEELKSYQDKYGQFELKHAEEFPKIRALLHEVLRFPAVSTTFGVPRTVRDDNVKIGGYSIPKNTMVYAFYTNFMHKENDENINWSNVRNFDINNFLDSNGKFHLNPAFSTFGIGRRNCPGSSLAKREIYILLGRILLRYKVLPDDKYDDVPVTIDLENPDPKIVVKLMSRKVKVVMR